MSINVSHLNSQEYNKSVNFKQLYLEPSAKTAKTLCRTMFDPDYLKYDAFKSLKQMEDALKNTKYLHGLISTDSFYTNRLYPMVIIPREFQMPKNGKYELLDNSCVQIRINTSDKKTSISYDNNPRFDNSYIIKHVGKLNKANVYDWRELFDDDDIRSMHYETYNKYNPIPLGEYFTKCLLMMDSAIDAIVSGRATVNGKNAGYNPYPKKQPRGIQINNKDFWKLFNRNFIKDLKKSIKNYSPDNPPPDTLVNFCKDTIKNQA